MRMYSNILSHFMSVLALSSIMVTVNAYSQESMSMDYTIYDELLHKYVDDQGMVNYQGLKDDESKLNAFVKKMNDVKEIDYNQWSEKEQMAYWINAYNVFTLKAIVDHYPIKAGWLGSLRFPKNSIRQISGVWDGLKFGAMGKQYSLNDIEHKVLRVKFNEPRIHVAIVCASIGCPPLRNEVFTENKLEEQLVDQSNKFLANQQNFKIDKNGGYVYLSSILSWFGEDFVKIYSTSDKFKHLGQTEGAVMNFISNYVSDEDKKYLENNKFYITYNSYDWTLNEQS